MENGAVFRFLSRQQLGVLPSPGVGVEPEGEVSPVPLFYPDTVEYGDFAVFLDLTPPKDFGDGDGLEPEADSTTFLEGGLEVAGAVGHF